MLLGEFRCSADGKGRLGIPAAFSTELAGGVTVTRGIEQCLVVYPTKEWEKLAAKLQDRLPLTSQPARKFNRFLFSAAAACVPNEAGQLPLPDHLRRYARIDGEAVVVGLLSHLEIWNPERWQRSKASFVDEGPTLADSLREFGI